MRRVGVVLVAAARSAGLAAALAATAGRQPATFPDPQVQARPDGRSSEFGTFDGDDVPGIAVARFSSPAAALGLHRLRPQRVGSTCPPANRLGCYELSYRVDRVRG